MTNMKATKRALLSSVLALFLCFSMLIGTTFAWFTDSVTSANNIIQSGNLDIELKYAKVVNGTMTEWDTVQGKDKIFDPKTLWEPGRVEVVYLEISNLGSLALKYQLGVNVVDELKGTNVAGEKFALSDHLVFKVVDVEENGTIKTFTDREAVEAAAGTEMGLADYNGVTTPLEVDGKDYVALIVYMPTSVGNEANHNGVDMPKITLGINLFATQMTAEEDSFGPDYDEDATHESFKVTTAGDLQAAINNGETNIELENDIVLDEAIVIPAPAATTFSLRAKPNAVVIDLNGKTITNNNGYVIESKGNVVITGNGTFAGLGGIRANGGSVTIESGNFYCSSDWNTGTYQHALKAVNTTVVINGGNFDATVNGQTNAMLNASENAVITINGGNFKNVEGEMPQFAPYIFTYEKNGAVVINDGTFYGGWRFNGETTTTDIYGGNFDVSFDGQSFHAASTHKVTVYGGIFASESKLAGKLETIVADGFKAAMTPNGYLIIPADSNYVADGVLVSTDGKTYYISNAAGYAWVDAQTDSFFLNKTVAFTSDIDFGGKTLTPVKFWNGNVVIDGQGHTLSNFVIGHSGSKTGSGLFVGTFNVQNLNVDKANVTGDYAGVISGQMYGNIDNCTVTNSTINGTYWQTGALVGQYNAGNITNCVVDGCTVNGMSAVGALVGILNETAGVRKIEGCTVKNTTIAQTGSFGGDYDKYFGVAVGLINVANSTVNFADCTFVNNTLKGVESGVVYGETDSTTTVIFDGGILVATTAQLIEAIKNAPVGETTVIYLTDFVYAGDINITKAALGVQGGDVVIKAMDGATPVISGNVTLGYRNQGVGAAMYDANVTFEGITFDQANAATHSIAVEDVKSLTLKNCTIISDGEYGIDSARGNATGTSKIVGCTFENAGMQLLGNFATGLVIDDCTFNNSRINVQAGNGVTVQNCTFNATLKEVNVDDSFYLIRSNSTPITVKECEINIDSALTEVVTTAQAKWYLLANRGTTNWTVTDVEVTMTEAALAQTQLKVTACTSTGVITTTNLTVNGVAK